MSATYYVDYDQGKDTNSGTSPQKPFKHAPGDPEAAGKVKPVALEPGDRVVFKGGVYYRGSLEIHWSGTKDRPLIYDGNTDGSFGSGQAILDGSVAITGWRQCQSAAECGGSPHWQKIYRAEAPAGTDCWTSGLLQDNRVLGIAQYPTPADYIFNDQVGEFVSAPPTAFTSTSITDPRLADLGGAGLVGAYVQVWRTTNNVDVRKIEGWDESTGTITFGKLGTPPYDDQDGRYAIVNSLHPQVFDRPGEYVFIEKPTPAGTFPVYLWPLDDADPNQAVLTVSTRNTAVLIGKASHYITIQGFKIQKYRTGITNGYGDWNTEKDTNHGLVIRDNVFTMIRQQDYAQTVYLIRTEDLLVEGNCFEYNAKQRGIAVHTSRRAIVRNNTLHKVGRTAIIFYYATDGTIEHNRVTDCTGTHSNGISVYLDSRDILVADNTVWNSNISLTCNNTENIIFRNNVFDGAGRAQPMAFWEDVRGNVVLENNILIRGTEGRRACLTLGGLGDKEAATFTLALVLKKNILHGPVTYVWTGEAYDKNVTYADNIFLSVPKDFPLGEGDRIEPDLSKLIKDADNHDYRRKAEKE